MIRITHIIHNILEWIIKDFLFVDLRDWSEFMLVDGFFMVVGAGTDAEG